MVQVTILPQSTKARTAEYMGQAFGSGIGQHLANQDRLKQQGQLAKMLFGEQSDQFSQLPAEQQLKAYELQQTRASSRTKAEMENQKALNARRESELLAKHQSGQELTQEERAELSPTSLRTLINLEKPTFEPTEAKLEAERVSNLATEIEKDYDSANMEDMRLGRQEQLAEKGTLPTPMMVKTLDSFGIPLAVLSNPDAEEYAKVEADYVRDVSKVFPGQIRVYEIQAYMKTIPSLVNSDAGKKIIIKNRRLLNEAKKLRYDAMKDIIKENGGTKPRNMGQMLNDRIKHRMNAIGEELRDGMSKEADKFQTKIKMIAPDGRSVSIPANELESAIKAGARFP